MTSIETLAINPIASYDFSVFFGSFSHMLLEILMVYSSISNFSKSSFSPNTNTVRKALDNNFNVRQLFYTYAAVRLCRRLINRNLFMKSTARSNSAITQQQ